MPEYRVIVASTEGGVIATAARDNWTVLKPIRKFDEVDTLHDHSLGDPGRLFIPDKTGFIALARKD